MKKEVPTVRFAAYILLLSIAFVFADRAQAQSPDLPLESIRTAFADGSASELVSGTTDRLEVSVLGEGMLYTKGQAHYVLRDFFKAHPPKSFQINKVARAGESWFVSGRYLSSKNGAPYRVYVRLRNVASERGGWSIQEIHVSHHDD